MVPNGRLSFAPCHPARARRRRSSCSDTRIAADAGRAAVLQGAAGRRPLRRPEAAPIAPASCAVRGALGPGPAGPEGKAFATAASAACGSDDDEIVERLSPTAPAAPAAGPLRQPAERRPDGDVDELAQTPGGAAMTTRRAAPRRHPRCGQRGMDDPRDPTRRPTTGRPDATARRRGGAPACRQLTGRETRPPAERAGHRPARRPPITVPGPPGARPRTSSSSSAADAAGLPRHRPVARPSDPVRVRRGLRRAGRRSARP